MIIIGQDLQSSNKYMCNSCIFTGLNPNHVQPSRLFKSTLRAIGS